MPVCKLCETELEYADTFDTDVWGDEVRTVNVGHCPNCGQTYKWTEIFTFNRFENLEECE